MTRWTEEEDTILRDNMGTKTDAEITAMLPNRTQSGVKGRRIWLGMKKAPGAPNTFTPEDDKFIRDNLEMGIKPMARSMDRDVSAVKHRMTLLGLRDPRGPGKYPDWAFDPRANVM